MVSNFGRIVVPAAVLGKSLQSTNIHRKPKEELPLQGSREMSIRLSRMPLNASLPLYLIIGEKCKTWGENTMFKTVASVALAALLTAGPAVAAEEVVPGLLYNLGGKFDKSFNEAAYNGAEKFKAETGIDYLEYTEDTTFPEEVQILTGGAAAGDDSGRTSRDGGPSRSPTPVDRLIDRLCESDGRSWLAERP